MAVLVMAGVLSRGDEILVARRKPGGPFPLKWEFPGGKLEPGEAPEEGLKRELREELGVEVEVGALLDVRFHRYRAEGAASPIVARVPPPSRRHTAGRTPARAEALGEGRGPRGDPKDVLLFFYECTLISGEPQALEVGEIAWVKRSELTTLDWLAADVSFVKLLASQ